MDNQPEPERFEGYELEHDPASFKGAVVNLGGKNGDLWEKTTIVDVERRLGWLLHLAGGNYIPNVYADPPVRRPITDTRCNLVYAHDVARGLLHSRPGTGEDEQR